MQRKKNKSQLKENIQKVLEEHGELKQNKLCEKLWEDYDTGYGSYNSLKVTVSNIREEMNSEGTVSTVDVSPSQGSLRTWKWRLEE